MTPERFAKVRQVFLAARERTHPEREAFITVECSGDEELERHVRELLEAESTDVDFLATPALGRSFDLRSLVDEPDAIDPLIGKQLGKYLVKSVIASGGMGTVYEAVQDQPHRTVALKVIRRSLSSRGAANRFIQEAEMLARLSHPGIAQVYEAGRHHDADGDVPFFAMEYVAGAQTLLDHTAKAGVSRRARLELFAIVCDAIQHAHQRGVIHRDLKPSNILIDTEGHSKVIDFGVACATEQNLRVTAINAGGTGFVGTPLYMSPEQFTDPSETDTRTDVYSLGVVLYELLCGRLPYDFETESAVEAARIVREVEPVRPSATDRTLRGDLEVILLKALEKDRTLRYQSASALADDLRLFLAGEPIRAHPPTLSYRMARFVSRRKWQVAAIVSAVLLVVITSVAGLLARAAERERRSSDLARAAEYGSLLTSAEADIREGKVANAAVLLDRAAARKRANEENGESWEWQHLHDRLDLSIASIQLPGEVTALACSPDGRWLAIGSNCGDEGGTVALWRIDPATLLASPGPVMYRFASDDQGSLLSDRVRPDALAFDASGRRLATGLSSGEILIWDKGDEEWRGGIAPQSRRWLNTNCTAIAFCPHNTDVLGIAGAGVRGLDDASGSQRAVLARISTDQVLASVPGSERGGVNGIAFSPNKNVPRVVVTDYDGDFKSRVYDIDDLDRPKLVAILSGHTFHVWDATFRSDGGVLATCSIDKTIRLWNVAASEREFKNRGQQASGIQLEVLRGHSDGVAAVCFLNDERQALVSAAGGSDTTIRLWEFDGVDEEAESPGGAPSLRMWHSGDPGVLRGHRGDIRAIAGPEDGRWFATGSTDRTVRLWLSEHVPDVPTLRGHTSSVTAVAFSADGGILASCSGAGDVALWDPKLATSIAKIWHQSEGDLRHVQSIAFHPNRRIVASAGVSGVLRVWDVSSPTSVPVPELWHEDLGARINGVAFDRSGQVLGCAGEDGLVHRWQFDWAAKAPPTKLADLDQLAGQAVDSLAFSPDGRWLAVGVGSPYRIDIEESRPIAVWDLRSPLSPIRLLNGHDGQVRCVTFSPDGRILASGSTDENIILWNVEDWSSTRLPPGHTDEVWSLAFHPTLPRLASGSADTTIRIWNLSNLTEAAALRGHSGRVVSLAFSPDGRQLASGSAGYLGRDNVVMLWEVGIDAGLRRERAGFDN